MAANEITINSIGMKLVLLKTGSFIMGSPNDEPERDADEGSSHPVKIAKDFFSGAHLVTQEQFQRVMGFNYSKFAAPRNPVEMVSKTEAELFCQRLSEIEGKSYSLPTESQWEYACRSGNQLMYCFGNDVNQLAEYAWYALNSGNCTYPVGMKKPNAWGLYDMHGNVWEWCQNCCQTSGYAAEHSIDPVCRSEGFHVIRGGSYLNEPQALRCAKRFIGHNNQRFSSVGFRVVLEK
jgi:formylglycine-generating enzyme required for sulfatase activity